METLLRTLRSGYELVQRLSPWSRRVNAYCIAQAGALAMEAEAAARRGGASQTPARAAHSPAGTLPIGRPRLLRVYVPRFADSSIEDIYTVYQANETDLGYLVMQFICFVFALAYLENDVVNPATYARSLRLGLRIGLLAWCAVCSLAFITRSACSPRVQLWMRTLSYIGLSLLINARLAYEPSQVTYIRGLGIWSLGLKSATACVDVGFFRASVFVVVDSIANSLLNSVFRKGTDEDPSRWEVLVSVWFISYAMFADLLHRNAFARACELYVTRIVCAEASKLHRFLTDSTMAMVCVHATDSSPPGTILYVSGACTPLTGWFPSELRGQHPSSFVHPEDSDKVVRLYTPDLPAARADGHPAVAVRNAWALARQVLGVSSGSEPTVSSHVDVRKADERRRPLPSGMLQRFFTSFRGTAASSELATPLLSSAGTRFGFESLSRLDEVTETSNVYIDDALAPPALEHPAPVSGKSAGQPALEGLPKHEAVVVAPSQLHTPVWQVQGLATRPTDRGTVVRRMLGHSSSAAEPPGAIPAPSGAGDGLSVPTALPHVPGTVPSPLRDSPPPAETVPAAAVSEADITLTDSRLDSLRRLSTLQHTSSRQASSTVVRAAVPARVSGAQPPPRTSPVMESDEEVYMVPGEHDSGQPNGWHAAAGAIPAARGDNAAQPVPLLLAPRYAHAAEPAGNGSTTHVRWRRKDGEYITLEVSRNPTADGIVCVYRDVSDRGPAASSTLDASLDAVLRHVDAVLAAQPDANVGGGFDTLRLRRLREDLELMQQSALSSHATRSSSGRSSGKRLQRVSHPHDS